MNKRIFSFILPIAAIAAAGCGGGAKGGVVAVVNGDSIGKDEFYRAMELKNSVNVVVDPQRLQSSGNSVPVQAYSGSVADGNIGLQTLKELVNQKVVMQLAAEQGVSPSSAEVDQEIETQKKDNPNFLKGLTSMGFTLDYIRNSVLVQLATEKIITRGIKIPDKDVDDYIAKNPEDKLIFVPARVELHYIVAKDAKDRDTIDGELATGKQFVVVATQYSLDQSAASNGYKLLAGGNNFIPDYEPKIQEIINKTDEGKQSTWYPQGPGFVKFFVEKKIPSSKIPITADLRKKISRRLALADGSKAIDLNKEVLNKLKAAKVEVQEEALKGPWEGYSKQLKSEPTKATGSPTATPSAAATK